MKILIDKNFEEFNTFFSKKGKISFEKGDEVIIPNTVKYIVPGFIDQHIHGALGKDTMDNTVEAIEKISFGLLREGTTSFIPTTMTYDNKVLEEVLEKIYIAMESAKGANVLGTHLEGPFISKDFIGAQNPNYVCLPNINLFNEINKKKTVEIVTYAPENDSNFDLTRYLSNNNIIASVGHSAASCEIVSEAIKNGLTNFTHFHNASSGHHHREPGVVTAGFLNEGVMVELIVDGIHLDPDVVKTTYKVKGGENIILITDSMRAKGCSDGSYDLGGQEVIKIGSEARLEDGTLAGSVLEMNVAIKNMINFSGCQIEEAFLMASHNPAKYLGLNNKGLLKEGFDFDVTCLDEDFNVIQTYVGGVLKYERGK